MPASPLSAIDWLRRPRHVARTAGTNAPFRTPRMSCAVAGRGDDSGSHRQHRVATAEDVRSLVEEKYAVSGGTAPRIRTMPNKSNDRTPYTTRLKPTPHAGHAGSSSPPAAGVSPRDWSQSSNIGSVRRGRLPSWMTSAFATRLSRALPMLERLIPTAVAVSSL